MKLRITIGGNTYEAEVEVLEEEETPALMAAPVVPPALQVPVEPQGDAPAAADRTCRSPVTGMVIRVLAEAGRMVESGDVLVVLEAMKMETRVTAPCAGRVEKVNVTAGNTVKMGHVLVELA